MELILMRKIMKIKYCILLAIVLLISSCNKDLINVESPSFDVTVPKSTYKVGEVIRFDLTGKAELISFYSGATLNDYSFKDNRVVDIKGQGASLEFASSVQVGTQAGQLSVWASADFDGDYSSIDKVKAGNFIDITSKFTLGTNATFVTSPKKDLSDIIKPGKPLYVAFKYVTKPQATNGLARQWFIQSFLLSSNNLFNDASLPIANQLDAGFRIVDENKTTAPARASISQTRITLYGNQYLYASLPIFDPSNPIYDPLNPIYNPQSPSYVPTAVRPTYVPFDPLTPYNDPTSEHWAISKAINVEQVNLGPDLAVPIKGLRDVTLKNYEYSYTKAGTYKVVFVASNNSIDSEQKVVKEITLTITP